MAELYRYNPHALAHHNTEARTAAFTRGERPEWDPATTDGTPKPPIHPMSSGNNGSNGKKEDSHGV